MPNGFFHPALHLFDQHTVYERLSEKGIPWRIYYGDIPQSLVITEQLKHVANYVTSMTVFRMQRDQWLRFRRTFSSSELFWCQGDSFGEVLLRRTSPRDDCPKSLPVPAATQNPMDVALNGHQAALAGVSHHLEVNQTNTGDSAELACRSDERRSRGDDRRSMQCIRPGQHKEQW
jgi:hypothetical protein